MHPCRQNAQLLTKCSHLFGCSTRSVRPEISPLLFPYCSSCWNHMLLSFSLLLVDVMMTTCDALPLLMLYHPPSPSREPGVSVWFHGLTCSRSAMNSISSWSNAKTIKLPTSSWEISCKVPFTLCNSEGWGIFIPVTFSTNHALEVSRKGPLVLGSVHLPKFLVQLIFLLSHQLRKWSHSQSSFCIQMLPTLAGKVRRCIPRSPS